MRTIWYWFYNLTFIPIAKVLLFFAQLFYPKIRTGLKGRKKLFENLIIDLAGVDRKKKMIWFHSASMGEFEQAKPIIEKIKAEKDVNVIVTFFSPSGYTNSLKYSFADVIAYFPFDTTFATKRFLNLVRPNLAVFMRYDIWPNMIWQLELKSIPCMIVDATMRKKTPRKWFAAKSFHKSLFSCFTKILTVSESDSANFAEFDLDKNKLIAVGDTRFDRVFQKSLDAQKKKLFREDFFNGKKVFVLGSSWESDEEVLIPALFKLMKNDEKVIAVIVPHEPTVLRVEALENQMHGKYDSIRFSLLNNYKNERVIIIDSIGVLLTLYYYAQVAYVGGSFKQGIHNVLEPAVYGIPVVFGPKHINSQEALVIVKEGGGITIKNKKDAYRVIRTLFSDEKLRKSKGEICAGYVKANIGATQKILQEIYKVL
ncbi:MAG: 3-deoxy-D-manno-octulosonic-acid transferase [Ignavibacteria bacterium]|nr:MAG: 3-deoxy-D-manno-octulosonic-acid transferase [Ignavibacteria bacterium]KAF0157958.1 MAG: 3-deoxy-D-manno-octulosonic-acid transferase [Ignavibacteria bacterium]